MLDKLKQAIKNKGYHVLDNQEHNKPKDVHVWSPKSSELLISIEHDPDQTDWIIKTYAYDNLTELDRTTLHKPSYQTLYDTVMDMIISEDKLK